MNILAFDTCLGACSVAVGLGAGEALEKVEALYEEMATGQAERLMPMIDAAMRSAGIGFPDLSRIAVTNGPGTFTGTRIGVAAARALALATGAQVVCMSTLELMALEVANNSAVWKTDTPLTVSVDANRGQVYVQTFDNSVSLQGEGPLLLSIADAAGLAERREMTFVGSGATLVAAAAEAQGYTAHAALPQLQPNAAFLLLASQDRDPQQAPVSPLYLRPADAKPQVGKSLARAQA